MEELFNADLEIICINREFQSLSKLDHPFIAELLEVFTDDNFIYFVSPFYTGGEINDLMYTNTTQANEDEYEPISEVKLKPLVFQLLKAMCYLKQNQIVHRDIKPQNIMIENPNPNHEQQFIKLIDFGFCLDLNEEIDERTQNLTEQVFMGTKLYSAPEVLEEYNHFVTNEFKLQSDMWSLGIIVFQLLSGEIPFPDDNEKKLTNAIMSCNYDFVPEEVWNSKSNECKKFIEKLLEPNPANRLTPEQALEHVWLKDQKDKYVASAIGNGVKESLLSYKKPSELMFIC